MKSQSAQTQPEKKALSNLFLEQHLIAISRRNRLKTEKRRFGNWESLQLVKSLLLPSLPIGFKMEQYVLTLATVYNNKFLNTHPVTKQEIPEYQTEETPRYYIDSLIKGRCRKFLRKQLFVRQNFALSSYEALKGAGFDIGW